MASRWMQLFARGGRRGNTIDAKLPEGRPDRIVVGLGNPGRRYEGTRHNLGFDVARRFVQLQGGERLRAAFDSELMLTSVGRQAVLVMLPQTYMNRSGRAVRAAIDRFRQFQLDRLLVICDDLNLPLGKLRFRPKGSDGGHRGLRDIIEELGTNEFHRLRLGIGSPPPGCDAAEYVLAPFSNSERQQVEEMIERAAEAVLLWCRADITTCMNQYN